MGEVESSTEITCIDIKTYLEDYMADIDLSTVPLSALTAEIKRRMTEFTEAQHMMSGFVPSTERSAPVSTTKRARHFSGNTMKAAAIGRWTTWKTWSANYPSKERPEDMKSSEVD